MKNAILFALALSGMFAIAFFVGRDSRRQEVNDLKRVKEWQDDLIFELWPVTTNWGAANGVIYSPACFHPTSLDSKELQAAKIRYIDISVFTGDVETFIGTCRKCGAILDYYQKVNGERNHCIYQLP